MIARWSGPLALSMLVACGPNLPDDGGGATGTGGSTGAGSGATTTAAPTTNASTTDAANTSSSGTSPGTAGATSDVTGPTSDLTGDSDDGQTADGLTGFGPCIADPAKGLCTPGCDQGDDCCRCSGTTFTLDPDAPTCELAMGIVTAHCPWSPSGLTGDGLEIPEVLACDDVNTTGWSQSGHDGDIWISLCADTCAAFMSGGIVTLAARVFCEAA